MIQYIYRKGRPSGGRNMINKKFGRLTVLKELEEKSNSNKVYLCKCECGNEKAIRGDRLKNGNTRSCGCLQKEAAGRRTVHGASSQWWYNRYSQMVQRCHNPKAHGYENYGAAGVYVCNKWINDPWAFGNWLIAEMDNLGLTEKTINGYHVDKDLLGKGYYGPDSCVLMLAQKNSALSATNRMKKCTLKNIETGETVEFKSFSDAAKFLECSNSTVSKYNGKVYLEWSIN